MAGPALLSWVPKLGVWAWSFVGFVAAMIIVVLALGAVSEIVLPMTFAAVLAVIFKPLVVTLRRHRFKPTLAAGVVVLGLLALMTGVVVATVQGVIQQTDQINASVDAAVDEAVESSGVDQASLDAAHYSGGTLRRSVVARFDPRLRNEIVVSSAMPAGPARLRARPHRHVRVVSVVIGLASLLLGLPLVFTIMVVNFIGGYIPYIGAFLGGGLAVIVALVTADPARLSSCSWWCSSQLGTGELRGAQGDGPLPRRPPGGGARRYRVRRPHRRHRRPHLGRPVLRDRSQRHRSATVWRLLRPGG